MARDPDKRRPDKRGLTVYQDLEEHNLVKPQYRLIDHGNSVVPKDALKNPISQDLTHGLLVHLQANHHQRKPCLWKTVHGLS